MSPFKGKEYIICAAIHYHDDVEHVHQPVNIKTGIVVGGRRHHNIIATVFDLANRKTNRGTTQGFLTSANRFVDRREGGEIAYAAGQITELTTCLFSEDLY